MAFDYIDARNTAAELINEFGADGSFTISDGSAGGYDNLGNVIPVQSPEVVNGIITPLLPFSSMTLASKQEDDGTQILKSDRFCFFYSEPDQAIPIGAYTTVSGETWRVISITKTIDQVDGINVFRIYHLRK